MKNKSLVLALAAFTLVALSTGCNKQETATPVAPVEQTKTPDQPAADTQKAAEAVKAADAQKEAEAAAQKQAAADKADQALKQEAAEKLAAEQVAAAKQSQLAAGGAKVQGMIDTAKSLAGEKRWTEVLKVLAQLAGEKLSPAQQTIVESLKSDAEKQAGAAVADKAAAGAGNAIGGLLQPKK
jgi:hypothetical protein